MSIGRISPVNYNVQQTGGSGSGSSRSDWLNTVIDAFSSSESNNVSNVTSDSVADTTVRIDSIDYYLQSYQTDNAVNPQIDPRLIP